MSPFSSTTTFSLIIISSDASNPWQSDRHDTQCRAMWNVSAAATQHHTVRSIVLAPRRVSVVLALVHSKDSRQWVLGSRADQCNLLWRWERLWTDGAVLTVSPASPSDSCGDWDCTDDEDDAAAGGDGWLSVLAAGSRSLSVHHTVTALLTVLLQSVANI